MYYVYYYSVSTLCSSKFSRIGVCVCINVSKIGTQSRSYSETSITSPESPAVVARVTKPDVDDGILSSFDTQTLCASQQPEQTKVIAKCDTVYSERERVAVRFDGNFAT